MAKKEELIFGSIYPGFELIVKATGRVFEDGMHIVRPGQTIKFRNGMYKTSDEKIIAVIEEFMKRSNASTLFKLPSIAEQKALDAKREKDVKNIEEHLLSEANKLKAKEKELDDREKALAEKETKK